MDGSNFDNLVRSLKPLRSRRTFATALGTAIGVSALTGLDTVAKKHKKRKKKCSQKCRNGCCTSKYGACISPDQQSTGLCGTGGEIRRSSGCAGVCPNCTCSASAPCPSGKCCQGDGTCGACLAFVSSSTQNGNLGGLTGADGRCQNLANIAGLPGTYKAWLSDSTGSPASRFVKATEAYTLVDGTVIAQNWDDLTSGTIRHAIDLTEEGLSGTDTFNVVWTATEVDGSLKERSPEPNTCVNWTSSAANSVLGDLGKQNLATSSWTDSGSFGRCNSPFRFYCFQQK